MYRYRQTGAPLAETAFASRRVGQPRTASVAIVRNDQSSEGYDATGYSARTRSPRFGPTTLFVSFTHLVFVYIPWKASWWKAASSSRSNPTRSGTMPPSRTESQRCLRQHGAVHRRADVEVAGSLDQLRRRRGAQAREDVCRCVATSRPQHVEPERFAIDKRVEPTGERPYRLALYRRGRDQAARPGGEAMTATVSRSRPSCRRASRARSRRRTRRCSGGPTAEQLFWSRRP